MLDRKLYIISDNFIFGVDQRSTKTCLNDDVKLSQNENYFNRSIRISKSRREEEKMKGKFASWPLDIVVGINLL